MNAHGEVFVLAEDDAEDERPTPSARAAFNRFLHAVAQSVAEAGDPSAVSDLVPFPRAEDDVNPLACKPRALVEAPRARTRLRNDYLGLQDRALRRGALHRKQQKSTLP